MQRERRSSRSAVLALLDETTGHVVLRLRSGIVLEGWVVEIAERTLRFEHAPSPFYAQATGTSEMAPPAMDIAIDDIAAYLDPDGVWQLMPAA